MPRLPLVSGALVLSAVAAAAVVAAGVLVPLAFGEVDRPWIMAAVVGGLVWTLTVLSLAAMAVAAKYGLTILAGAYLGTTGLRMVGTLGGALALATTGVIESGPPLGMVLAMVYLPMLTAEVTLLALFLRRRGYEGWEPQALPLGSTKEMPA